MNDVKDPVTEQEQSDFISNLGAVIKQAAGILVKYGMFKVLEKPKVKEIKDDKV